ncbi:MAG: siderophore-interacting protein [Propionibacterium sp.]|nr:siderophore-interacting protein [Propionibacterium sp.]
MTEARRRPDRPKTLLTVRGREWINPAMARLTFDAPGFTPTEFTDAYVKLIFDDEGPVLEDLPERPTTRTYTVRSHDPATERLVLDFVIHGDAGLAAPWAARCEPGDQVLAQGPGGKWGPAPEADFLLLVGDESSVPAIEGALERLDDDARGLVILDLHEHAFDLTAPAGIEIRQLVRGDGPYREERLAEEVATLPLAEFGDVQVFAHGERGAMKALRPIFRELGLSPERLSISGYWALGRVEDEFQAEKRTEIGKI